MSSIIDKISCTFSGMSRLNRLILTANADWSVLESFVYVNDIRVKQAFSGSVQIYYQYT